MTVELKIEIPVFNFDIVQGQDLTIPITYTKDGVADSMAGASLKMEIRPQDYSAPIDTLSTSNGRIAITGTNKFSLDFPAVTTTKYQITAAAMRFIYGLEHKQFGKIKRLFEGVVTVKREQTKKLEQSK